MQQTDGGTREMELITKLYVKAQEYKRGQAMTEYALIMGAIAVVCIAAYQIMGTRVNTLITNVNNAL
jgi:Flp pilus assembly pilin Flp